MRSYRPVGDRDRCTEAVQAKIDRQSAKGPSARSMLLAGLVPWIAIAETVGRGHRVDASRTETLIKKFSFPTELLAALPRRRRSRDHALIAMGVLAIAVFAVRWAVLPEKLWLLPIVLLSSRALYHARALLRILVATACRLHPRRAPSSSRC